MNIVEEYCCAPMNYVGGQETIAIEVPILNGRNALHLNWREHGFELIQHSSAVTDWFSESEVKAKHYAEMAALAKQLTGCTHALVAGHISRNPEQAELHQDYAPIQFVHSDFTDNYGRLVTERYLSGNPESERALASAGLRAEDVASAKRMLILQFWRNVGPEIVDLPLAFCDAQTVPRQDMQALHVPSYAGGDFAFDTFAVTPPPSGTMHDWYVFPEMTADEVVAFRTFDSDRVRSGKPFWTPHSAFPDPTVRDSAPARCSIEVRATCLFT